MVLRHWIHRYEETAGRQRQRQETFISLSPMSACPLSLSLSLVKVSLAHHLSLICLFRGVSFCCESKRQKDTAVSFPLSLCPGGSGTNPVPLASYS